jgi:hypothetical protein
MTGFAYIRLLKRSQLMAKIIRLLDYEPVFRPQGFRPSQQAEFTFFTGVRYEHAIKEDKKKTPKSKSKQAYKTRAKSQALS